ncbi:MAG: radical SAM protein [Candidatus Aenigmatarchaeota archaeon]
MNDIFEAITLGKKVEPKLLMLSPTDYCNLACKICWRLKEDAKFSQPSFNFLKKIIKEASEMKVKTIDLTGGGEPFVRGDILNLMKLVKKLGMKGTLTTNSTLIKKSHIKNIVKMKWDEINLSLDGSTPEINDYIRGEGTFEKVLEKIKTFQEIKKNNNSSNPLLRLCFTITSTNFQDLPNYIKLAKHLDIKNINFSILFKWESNREFWLKQYDKEKVNYILRESSRLAKSLDIKTNLEPIKMFGIWKHEPPKFCFAPWYMLFINASREAMACCTLASLYQNKLGKVNSLEEVWFSRKMEMLRERMKKRIFFKECKRCLPEFTQMFNQMYGEMKRWSLKKSKEG